MWGILACLWKEVLVSALRAAVLKDAGIGMGANDRAKDTIFASMRFANGQPLREAKELQKALEKRGLNLKIVELEAGDDINEEVFQSIEK